LCEIKINKEICFTHSRHAIEQFPHSENPHPQSWSGMGNGHNNSTSRRKTFVSPYSERILSALSLRAEASEHIQKNPTAFVQFCSGASVPKSVPFADPRDQKAFSLNQSSPIGCDSDAKSPQNPYGRAEK